MNSKQALIITAYCELEYLRELLEIYAKYFQCYVHIDKKCKVSETNWDELNSLPNVSVIQRCKINWGSYKHIQAIIDLINMAINEECSYFHIISASTIPVKNPLYILDFFDCNQKIYMEVHERKELSEKDKYISYKLFESRYQVFYFLHMYNRRNGPHLWRMLKYMMTDAFARIQRIIGIRRKIAYDYRGYVYCHFPFVAAKYLVDYLNYHPEYLKNLKYCFVGEEFFFQNIFMNSKFKGDVVNDTKIYDIWNKQRGFPAFLNTDDLNDIQNSGYFFARKVGEHNKIVLDEIRKRENF